MTIEHITLAEPAAVIDARIRADARQRLAREKMLREHMEKLRRTIEEREQRENPYVWQVCPPRFPEAEELALHADRFYALINQ